MEPQPHFENRNVIAGYAEATLQKVPGLADLHRMAMLLLAERAPQAAHLLVLGAGGGLELKAFAVAQPHWSFVGVDPSAGMIALAAQTLGTLKDRVELVQGYVEAAPPGPYDGATCLLTLHFLERDERLRTLREMRRRMKPGAPLVVAHHSAPVAGGAQRWLTLSAAFAGGSAIDFEKASASAAGMAAGLRIVSPDEDEAILREAGFSDVALFYAGLSFRGWVAAA